MKVWSLAALLAGLLICGEAGAHSFYSKQCCNDRDCFPVDRISKRRDGGYDVIVKGKYSKVPGSFANTYLSGDMKYHICFREPLGAEPYAKCLYVPEHQLR
jgi:hypothetical protein